MLNQIFIFTQSKVLQTNRAENTMGLFEINSYSVDFVLIIAQSVPLEARQKFFDGYMD